MKKSCNCRSIITPKPHALARFRELGTPKFQVKLFTQLILAIILFSSKYAVAAGEQEELARLFFRANNGKAGPGGIVGSVSSPYLAPVDDGRHAGIDYRSSVNNPTDGNTKAVVYSPVYGIVKATKQEWGYLVIEPLRRTDRRIHLLHLSEIYVRIGEYVAIGDKIGRTGDVPYAGYPLSGVHMHVEYRPSNYTDPAPPSASNLAAITVNPIEILADQFASDGEYHNARRIDLEPLDYLQFGDPQRRIYVKAADGTQPEIVMKSAAIDAAYGGIYYETPARIGASSSYSSFDFQPFSASNRFDHASNPYNLNYLRLGLEDNNGEKFAHRLYFHTTNLRHAVLGTSASSSDNRGKRKIAVMIHGWNPSKVSNPFKGNDSAPKQFALLAQNLVGLAAKADRDGERWPILQYDWGEDASTGGTIGLYPDGQDSDGVNDSAKNGMEAAEIAFQHGFYLGELIRHTYPDATTVVIYAHSAGSWAARSAAYYLLNECGRIKEIQITLLDPYMPANSGKLEPNYTSPLDENLMNNFAQYLKSGLPEVHGRKFRLENYYIKGRTFGTHSEFASFDINSSISGYSAGAPIVWVLTQDDHSAPIEFYAKSVPLDSWGYQPTLAAESYSGAPRAWTTSHILERRRGFQDSLMGSYFSSATREYSDDNMMNVHWARTYVNRCLSDSSVPTPVAVYVKKRSARLSLQVMNPATAWRKIDCETTRGEFASMLWSLVQRNVSSTPVNGEMQRVFLLWRSGLASGDSNKNLSNVMDYMCGTSVQSPAFTDISGTSHAQNIVEIAKRGVVSTSNTTFRPNDAITLREATVMCWRFFGGFEGRQYPFASSVPTHSILLAKLRSASLMDNRGSNQPWDPQSPQDFLDSRGRDDRPESSKLLRGEAAKLIVNLYDKAHDRFDPPDHSGLNSSGDY